MRTNPLHLISGWASTIAVLLAAGCGSRAAERATAEAEGPPSEVVTLWSAELELFMEHPLLIAGQRSAPWAVHLTRLRDFRPVGEGRLTLEFAAPDGAIHRAEAASPARPGIFGPEVLLPSAGNYDLTIVYRGTALTDTLWVGPVHVFGSEAELPTTAPEPETGIVLLKEQQWATRFGTAEAVTRAVAEALPAAGDIVAADGAIVGVDAPLAGLLLPAAVVYRGHGPTSPSPRIFMQFIWNYSRIVVPHNLAVALCDPTKGAQTSPTTAVAGR